MWQTLLPGPCGHNGNFQKIEITNAILFQLGKVTCFKILYLFLLASGYTADFY